MLAVLATLVIAGFQVFEFRETTQTRWGPLGPADRDLLVNVRFANLWEIPAAQMAQERGASQRVREVGGLLAAEHTELDEHVRATAAQLGAPLPNEPSKQHLVWLAEIGGTSGSDLDRTLVQRLRFAHGKIMPVVSEVRASTQNELIREFTDIALSFIHRHMGYLESTGLVDEPGLPAPPAPHTTGLPPNTVPAEAAIPAEVLAPSYVSGRAQGLAEQAHSAAVYGGSYLATAVAAVAGVIAIVGPLVLLRRRPQPPQNPPPRSGGKHSR